MSKLIVGFGFLFACATTGRSLDPNVAGDRARVQLDLAPSDTAAPAFPAALEPAVPSVDRIASSVRAALGSVATAELDLCVAPSGRVAKVELARSSSYDAFDGALLRDAKDWQFAVMPGPATVQSCRRATVAYRAR